MWIFGDRYIFKIMNQETLWEALQRQRRLMSLNGVLDISNVSTEDLSPLGSQKSLIELKLVKSAISSLHTLPIQPSMKIITGDYSRIQSFGGLANQPRLSQISFIGTPLTEQDNFRIAAIICIGPRLSKINGIPVTKSERRKAACYPPIAKYLVSSGWIVSYPPPSKLDFRYIADQLNVPYTNEDLVSTNPIIDASQSGIQKDISQSREETSAFNQKIASILRPLGFAIRCGPEMNEDIVNAVSNMCSVVAKIEALNENTNDQ